MDYLIPAVALYMSVAVTGLIAFAAITQTKWFIIFIPPALGLVAVWGGILFHGVFRG